MYIVPIPQIVARVYDAGQATAAPIKIFAGLTKNHTLFPLGHHKYHYYQYQVCNPSLKGLTRARKKRIVTTQYFRVK